MNGSFTSPVADAQYVAAGTAESAGLLFRLINDATGWTVFTAILLMLVVYDQGKLSLHDP